MHRKIFAVPLFLSLLLSGCFSNNKFFDKYDFDFGATETPNYEVKDTKTIQESTYFKWHGRHYYDEERNVTFFNFSASGFEVSFIGTSIEGCFYSTRADDNKNRPYLAVSIDNDYDPDKAIPIQLTSGVHSNVTRKEGNYFVHDRVVLAQNLENKKHTIRVYKRSECLISKVGLKSVSTDGEIIEVDAKPLDYKLEFYGDSVTCGYAVESDNFYERFSSRTENAMKTYANVAANILNADVSLISCGGYPMYQSKYSKDCSPDNIPAMFSLADVEYHTKLTHQWDNSKYIPDVIVIALGANDGSILRGLTGQDRVKFLNTYKQKYIDFISLIRNTYGEDKLVIVSDEILELGSEFNDAMDEVASYFNSDKVIRAKYSAYEKAIDRTLPGEGHPNKEMQYLAGVELADLILKSM